MASVKWLWFYLGFNVLMSWSYEKESLIKFATLIWFVKNINTEYVSQQLIPYTI